MKTFELLVKTSLLLAVLCFTVSHPVAISSSCQDTTTALCSFLSNYDCYNSDKAGICCETCAKFFTGLVGCEYGDSRAGCDRSQCDAGDLATCCFTCNAIELADGAGANGTTVADKSVTTMAQVSETTMLETTEAFFTETTGLESTEMSAVTSEATMAETTEFTMSQTTEMLFTETTESLIETTASFTETTEGFMTETTESLETETTEVPMTETTESVVTETTEVFTETTEAPLTDTTETLVTETTEIVATETTEVPMTETTESEATETTEVPMTETTESEATETTEVPMTETTESEATETTESVATETTEVPMTETTESVATDTTESVVTETTESVATETTEVPMTETTESEATETTEIPMTETTESVATETTESIATETTEAYLTETSEMQTSGKMITETTETLTTETMMTETTERQTMYSTEVVTASAETITVTEATTVNTEATNAVTTEVSASLLVTILTTTFATLTASPFTQNYTLCDYFNNATSTNFTYCQLLQDPQNAVNWTVNNGRTPSAKKRNRMIAGVTYPATGPLSSTSGNGYLYVPSKDQPAGSMSRVFFGGDQFQGGGLKCLHYNYSMNGYHMGTLTVRGRYAVDSSLSYPLWAVTGDQGFGWSLAEVDIDMDVFSQVSLEMMFTGGFYGDGATDSMFMTDGPCEPLVLQPGELWYCNFERRDGTQTICNMVLDRTATYYWTTLAGDTPSVETGPARAYNGDYYIYTDTSNHNQSDTASMYGFHMGTLRVYVTSAGGGVNNTLWQLSGNQGPSWFFTTVTVPPLYPNMQIVFEGIRGSGYSGDSAVDDIHWWTGVC